MTLPSGDRQRDQQTVKNYESLLGARIEDKKLRPEARKAALRQLICAQRGVDYDGLAATDATRVAIDREVQQRFDELVAKQAKETRRAQLDVKIDDGKASRASRLDAFFAEFLLDKGIEDFEKRKPEEQQKLHAEFDQTQVARFDLRDGVLRRRQKNLAIIKNKALPQPVRLALGVRFSAMKTEQQAEIDKRFESDIVPSVKKADTELLAAKAKRSSDLALAKTLEAKLKPHAETKVFAWGSVKKITAPNLPEVFRQVVSLRTGLAKSSKGMDAKVDAYHDHVTSQNDASAKALSSAYYFDIGYRNVSNVTRAVIEELWPGVAKDGVPLADAMFPAEGMPLIAGSQRAPILIRAGALKFGGEKPEVLANMIERGRVLISDLLRPIVLLTPDVMNKYLGAALLEKERDLIDPAKQAELQEYVLGRSQADAKKGVVDGNKGPLTSLADLKRAEDEEAAQKARQIKDVEKILGPNPKTVDGFEFKVGDFNSQASTISKTQAKMYDDDIAKAQGQVTEQQRIVDEIRDREVKYRDTIRKNGGGMAGIDPASGYSDPDLTAAENELARRQAILGEYTKKRTSYTDLAAKLDNGTLTYEGLRAQSAQRQNRIDLDIEKYEGLLKSAQGRAAEASKKVRSINDGGLGKDKGSGSEYGPVIAD